MIVEWLSALAAVQSLALAAALVARPTSRTTANRCLAGALLALAINLAGDGVPRIQVVGYFGFAFVGPLVFLHVDAVAAARLDRAPTPVRPHLIGGLVLLLLLGPYLAAPPAVRQAIDAGTGGLSDDARFADYGVGAFSFAVVAQQFAYLLLAARRLPALRSAGGDARDWVRTLLLAAAGLWVAYVVSLDEPLLQMAIAIVLQGLAVVAILRPEPFAPLARSAARRPRADGEPSYSRSRLSESVLADILDRVAAAMAERHVYRDPNLDLARLAKLVGTRPDDLSQAFSRRGGRNFYDVVAEWRVRAACDLLADPEHAGRTVLDIAYEVGFNSKSVFHESFRRYLQTTPGKWRGQALANTARPVERP